MFGANVPGPREEVEVREQYVIIQTKKEHHIV